MTNEVEIQAIRAFNKTPQGDLCEAGDRFAVSEVRAGELERLGLATRTKPKPGPEKAAEPAPNKAAVAPQNKMAFVPKNKAARLALMTAKSG